MLHAGSIPCGWSFGEGQPYPLYMRVLCRLQGTAVAGPAHRNQVDLR